MAPQLTNKTIIERETLREVAEARLKEAETLFKAKHYAGAIYLAGYAVECYLKVAICVTMHWSEMRETFKTHDLELLMLHSGFDYKLQENAKLVESFAKIKETWAFDREKSVRYKTPSDFNEKNATLFLQYVSNPETGVVPWLRKITS